MYCGEHNGRGTGGEREGNGRGTGGEREGDDYDMDEASSGDASGSYTMTGYVDKYPITMYLSFSGSNVTGWYYYDKYKAKMTFTGTYSGSSLDLYCEGGDAFYGTFVNGAYSGHFSGNNGNEMNFNVSQ